MAQILVPFFRRYVDKDKVSDAEQITATQSQDETDRPSLEATQDRALTTQAALPLESPPQAPANSPDLSDERKGK